MTHHIEISQEEFQKLYDEIPDTDILVTDINYRWQLELGIDYGPRYVNVPRDVEYRSIGKRYYISGHPNLLQLYYEESVPFGTIYRKVLPR